MREVFIEPKAEGKGRTFRAVLLATVVADPLWSGGNTDTPNLRPVWAMFGGSDNELRAFMANLTSGKKALFSNNHHYRRKEDCLEILKSAKYQVTWQREPEGSLTTIFLPDLFQIDPGMVDPKGIQFILLPTQEWYTSQNIETQPLIKHIAQCRFKLTPQQVIEWAPLAYLFAAYLDRRTRCPLVADGKFYMQLMLSCLNNGLASFSTDSHAYYREEQFGVHPSSHYHETDTIEVGLVPGLAFNSDHSTFESLLAKEVSTYFDICGESRG